MMQAYVSGATKQALARVRSLQEKIAKQGRRELSDLRRICDDRLGELASDFETLSQLIDKVWHTEPKSLIRKFEGLQIELARVETEGVLALIRHNSDDVFLGRLVDRICQNIDYPLITPTVSHTSREYFVINREFNLISVPPNESRFLLHLPDLYHELVHPMLWWKNRQQPALSPLALKFALTVRARIDALFGDIRHEERIEGPERDRRALNSWRVSWATGWTEEFFCDLFATFWTGPAYGWSHLHLSMKLQRSPFETPLFSPTSHPPDDARMRAILVALNRLGFENDASRIQAAWDEFCQLKEGQSDMDYARAFPAATIDALCDAAFEGFHGLGATPCSTEDMTEIATCLNQAWSAFWQSPDTYPTWETAAVERLKSSL